jgi:hypothetical protein
MTTMTPTPHFGYTALQYISDLLPLQILDLHLTNESVNAI